MTWLKHLALTALAALSLTGCGREPNNLAAPAQVAVQFAPVAETSARMSGLITEAGFYTEFLLEGEGFDPDMFYTAWLRDDQQGIRRILAPQGIPPIAVSPTGDASYLITVPANVVAPWDAIEIYRHPDPAPVMPGADPLLVAPLPPVVPR